jgi:DNA-binding transcriptional MerR regulator
MNETYTLEVLAEMTGVSTQTIVQYQAQGLVRSGYDDETVRSLRRLEALRESCGMDLQGLKLLAHLLDEVEQLREALRARR